MTPPDTGVLSTRLAVMNDLLDYLAGLPDIKGQHLRDDLQLRLAVERALSQLVDQAVDINGHIAARVLGRPPQTQRESFELAVRAGHLSAELAGELQPSVGLRNVLIHEYVTVDLDRVAAAIPMATHGYRGFVRHVARTLCA